jgi:hypothetical protein
VETYGFSACNYCIWVTRTIFYALFKEWVLTKSNRQGRNIEPRLCFTAPHMLCMKHGLLCG